jgi:16S rRNA (cytosine1402-N4)-methyltransferase
MIMKVQALTSVRAKTRLRREEGETGHERKSGQLSGDMAKPNHISVMVEEAISLLDLKKGEIVIDGTFGMGGHSEAILTAAPVRLVALDADEGAVMAGREKLERYADRLAILNANFRDLDRLLVREGIESIDKALFDLGWNKEQLASGRGFSFLRDEPLNMSYGQKPASGFTAAEILNTWEEKVIADVLFGYGEERFARRIAKAVVERRAVKPFETTIELVEVIRDAVPSPYRHARLHFATKSFQALRIAVNDELGAIEAGLKAAWEHLSPGGRIVVITFHSIEDRLVKKTFTALAKKDGRLVIKKPLTASRAEITHNSSSRSAKMRAIEKVREEK